jgi:hypothetical protein
MTDAPKRIQLRRTKGWRIPKGAVIVDRRSKWGNWYKPVQVGSLYKLQHYVDALPDPKAWIVVTLDNAPEVEDALREALGGYLAVPLVHFDADAPVTERASKYGSRTGSQWGGFADKAEATAFAVEMHARSLRATRLDLDGLRLHDYYLGELRGHDLACWCPLGAPCHADVLLELANAPARSEPA